MNAVLPVGKLPHHLLADLLAQAPSHHERVLLGPGIGLDCAVLDMGETALVLKTEPITFATQEIGWYAVQIASNDIATTGALPRWMLATLLLPEGKTTPELVSTIGRQIFQTCQQLGITLIGGHTEITYDLHRPIIVTTLIGEIAKAHVITPRGAQPGDVIILTKGIPIEGCAILAREFAHRLEGILTPEEIQTAQRYIYEPGISVLKDAQLAIAAGRVTAMHDPTEGGLATALWELAEAAGVRLRVEQSAIPISPLAQKICAFFGLDPLGTLASGALLLTTHPHDAPHILKVLTSAGIPAAAIGRVESGTPEVFLIVQGQERPLPYFARDEIARFYEQQAIA
ncbi:AIR synthase family protein [Thermanaerothrix sp. 4228-RoL]|uniref:AIR synthase family protein n=1 Tax=Thermanaerothrix solaris TaxID=3058434 RepID=A0ABU3NL16_9CHLR|nr:AIR synthase family protein [Thermanaerothrix sp. 4228-RoL]MDT8897540.1 AIR synthase family protein [Thermanaerothrix sp. 4228-RoL]